jgi:hypothetical protein
MRGLEPIIEALLPEWPPLDARVREGVLHDTVGSVVRQLSLAPAHISFGIRALLVGFRIYAFVRLGLQPLGLASPSARAKALAEFSALPLPMVEGLERVLRATTVLAFMDNATVLAAIGEDA